MASATCPAVLDWRRDSRPGDWRSHRHARLVVAVGVDEPETRARLLCEGIGDALSGQVAPIELAARLLKLQALAPRIARHRQAGPVTLDLYHRDGRLGGSWLGLHPREFKLLWRLAEPPLRRVSKRELLSDVWRLDHVPETNSLEVHVSRLRAKLAVAGLGWLVRTCEGGGYCLGDNSAAGPVPAASCGRETLDTRRRIDNAW